MGFNLTHTDSDSVTIEKIEVYESCTLHTSYSKVDLEGAGIQTELNLGNSVSFSIDFKYGIWKDNSFCIFYQCQE
jgi:hypothetical protein